jgi:hypothetical protein
MRGWIREGGAAVILGLSAVYYQQQDGGDRWGISQAVGIMDDDWTERIGVVRAQRSRLAYFQCLDVLPNEASKPFDIAPFERAPVVEACCRASAKLVDEPQRLLVACLATAAYGGHVRDKEESCSDRKVPLVAFLYETAPRSVTTSWSVPDTPISFHDAESLTNSTDPQPWIYSVYDKRNQLCLMELSSTDKDTDCASLLARLALDSIDSSENTQLNAFVASTLSSVGGLHREWQHQFTVSFGAEITAVETGYLTLEYLLHVGSDVFVNVEDAVQILTLPFLDDDDLRSRWNISIQHDPYRVIDQEEPAFVSPQHVVLVQLQGPMTRHPGADQPMVFETVTKLHLRYPEPLDQGTCNFVQFPLMPPNLLQASFVTASGQRYQQHGSVLPRAPPVGVWIATGRASDYIWVVTVSVLASVVGAVVILRDLHPIATW